MEDKTIILHEFLLLFLNLAQMKQPDRVVCIFQQAWNAHDLGIELNYSNEPFAGELCDEIATSKNSFGFFILRKSVNKTSPGIMPLARNLVKMLAVILENLQRENLLNQERLELEKKVEDRVSENRQKQVQLENAQALGKIGSWDLDISKNELTWTEENYRIFGEPAGRPITYEIFLNRVHPDDREYVDRKWTAAMRNEASYDIEHRLQMDDGEVKWVREKAELIFDEAGQCLRGIGFTQDTTERKRAEEALKFSEASIRKKLKAITEPESDLGVLELSDLIDADEISSLMEDFYAVTGMVSAIVDLKGNVLFGVGWQDICTQFHRAHPETAKHCCESDMILSQNCSGKYNAYRCKNNMWDLASPIEIAGQHVGNIFFGQFFYDDEEVDEECFRKQAYRYGFDEKQYLAALSRVPRFSRKTVNKAMSFYTKLADLIARQSYSNIKLSRALAEREKAQNELLRERNLLEEAQKIAHLGIFEFVAATQTTEWSEEEFRIYGLDPAGSSPSYEKMLAECIHPDDASLLHDTFMQAIQSLEVYELEHRIVHPDGTVRWVYDRAMPTINAQGELERYIGITLDITAHKLSEQKLQEAHDLLEQRVEERTAELNVRKNESETLNRAMINLLQDLKTTNRGLETAQHKLSETNQELESFAYSVSHDLRAPLRHIEGFVNLLLKREADHLDDTSARYLDTIAQSSNRMGELIDDLLAFSRTGRTEMHLQPADSTLIVQDAIQELSSLTKDRRIEWEIGDLPSVMADRGLLRLVWGNLIGNAVKYTAPREEARIEIGAKEEKDENGVSDIVFFVRDNGVGFEPQYTDKLFGVFQRLHRDDEFEGTGIGLATVKRIVHRHGGQVRAEGKVDEGASFYFTLRKPKEMKNGSQNDSAGG